MTRPQADAKVSASMVMAKLCDHSLHPNITNPTRKRGIFIPMNEGRGNPSLALRVSCRQAPVKIVAYFANQPSTRSFSRS